MIKIGLAGTDEKSLQHLEALASVPGFHISGVWGCNGDKKSTARWCDKAGVNRYETFEHLLQNAEAVVLSSTLPDQFPLAVKAIKRSKHLFIDHPTLYSPEEILKLIHLSREAGVKVQMNYPERFNPAYSASLTYLSKPLYIEAQRHMAFSGKSSHVPVVTDLMMDDIDIILSIVKANIRTVHARGVDVFNGTPDIVNVNLEFDNGVVANLTANRIAAKNIHRIKFYQHKARIQADFLKHRIKILRKQNSKVNNTFMVKDLSPPEKNHLVQALSRFFQHIARHKEPVISLDHAYENLKAALLINEKLEMLTS